MAIKIMHYKQTEIANAPDELSRAINKYSHYKSICVFDYHGENFKKYKNDKTIDIIHFHNKYFNTDVPSVIQYHSEPERCLRKYPKEEAQCLLENKYYKMVISQYHATLPEYKNFHIVRNIINFEDSIYNLNPVNKIKIGFSPSILDNRGKWYNKGYLETKKILENINKKYKIEYDIIVNSPLIQCLKRKSNCNIIIDECVTGSYHRSGLEGLALGKLTICGLNEDVENIFLRVSNSLKNPFINVFINNLENKIEELINTKTVDDINDMGENNRKWMNTYWNPYKIVGEYIEAYRTILENNHA